MERPILFSGPMVRAILDGRKTVTRRIIKPQPTPHTGCAALPGDWAWRRGSHTFTISNKPNGPDDIAEECPYGAPGDRLWIKERMDWRDNGGEPRECGHVYAATPDEWVEDLVDVKPLRRARNVPSIHMPRWASRITLEVVSVRAERVQDITEEDAIAEGFPDHCHSVATRARQDQAFASLSHLTGGAVPACPAIAWFRMRWIEIDGHGSWESNPWVWRIEFRRIKP